MNVENELKELFEVLKSAVGAEAETFETAEGDRLAIVRMQDIISVGVLESNGRISNAVFTPVEAKRLAYKLLDFANNL